MSSGDIDLSMDEIRAVVTFAVGFADDVLPEFERVVPDDPRPREAVEAARSFALGEPRSNRQRSAAVGAHRAAKAAPSETARWAALACGDAAAAAYLHPIARSTQVGHILRAAACAARIGELTSGRPIAEIVAICALRAAPPLPEILRRYPPLPPGRGGVSSVMHLLDSTIRES